MDLAVWRWPARMIGLLSLGWLCLLAVLPPARLDQMPQLCLVQRIWHRPCWSCGTSHAFSALLHGEVALALQYHPYVMLSFAVFLSSLAACAVLGRPR